MTPAGSGKPGTLNGILLLLEDSSSWRICFRSLSTSRLSGGGWTPPRALNLLGKTATPNGTPGLNRGQAAGSCRHTPRHPGVRLMLGGLGRRVGARYGKVGRPGGLPISRGRTGERRPHPTQRRATAHRSSMSRSNKQLEAELAGIAKVNHIVRHTPDALPGYREIDFDVLAPKEHFAHRFDERMPSFDVLSTVSRESSHSLQHWTTGPVPRWFPAGSPWGPRGVPGIAPGTGRDSPIRASSGTTGARPNDGTLRSRTLATSGREPRAACTTTA